MSSKRRISKLKWIFWNRRKRSRNKLKYNHSLITKDNIPDTDVTERKNENFQDHDEIYYSNEEEKQWSIDNVD